MSARSTRALCAVLAASFVCPPPALLFAQDLPPPPAREELTLDRSVLDRVGIDPTTGRLELAVTDLVVGEGEYAFEVTRHYRRWAGDRLDFGFHWASSLDVHLDVHPSGRAATFVDEQGDKVYFRRDAAGHLVAISGSPARVEADGEGWVVSGLGDERVYAFDAEGYLRSRTGPAGFRLAFFYDGEQRLRAVQGPWGELRVKRDAAGMLTALEAPGRLVRYEHDEEGHLRRVVREGRYQDYRYDAAGRLSALADGNALVGYDSVGRVIRLGGPGLHETTARYLQGEGGDWAQRTELTQGERTQRWSVSLDGRRIEHEDADGLRTVAHFDERERLVRLEAPDGRVLENRFDAQGRLRERSGPDGTVRFEYGSKVTERPTKITLADGREVRFVFDLRGNVTDVIAPGGATTRYRYDARGRLVELVDARGAKTSFVRDERGAVLEVSEDGVGVTRFLRDADGLIVKVKRPDGRLVTVTRDRLGRAMQVTDALGSVHEVAYDDRGRVVRFQDEHGKEYHYTWSARGDLEQVRTAAGELLSFRYDAAGEVVAITDAAGNATAFERPAPRTTRIVDATTGERLLKHDERGLLVEEVRGGETIRYGYDAQARLVRRETSRGAETFEYDAHGKLLAMAGPDGGFRFAYGEDGRLRELTDTALGESVGYRYDAAGDRTGLLLPWGEVGYRYDAQGRLVGVDLPEGGRIEIEVHPDGRRKEVRYPNGVVTRFAYSRSRLSEVVTTKGEVVLERRAYGYDEQGRVAWSEDAAKRRTTYGYDAAGRLVSAEGPEGEVTWGYDATGNRTSETRSAGTVTSEVAAGNRVVRREAGDLTETLSYSAAGALTARTRGEETTRFRYDADGRLLEVQGAEGAVRYGYAPNGTRLWREDGAGRVHFLNDLADVVGEFGPDGALRTSYVHGPEDDDVLAARHGDESFFYHYDLVRSVTALTGKDGRVAARYAYDPFGAARAVEGDAAAWNPFRYTSREHDATSGLYHYRARAYAPDLGRFTTPDPVGLFGGTNLYAYVGNDPLRFNDPYGLWPSWLDRAWEGTKSAVSSAASWVVDTAAPAVWEGVKKTATNSWAFTRGFGKGLWNAGKGIVNMVIHPIDTVKGIYHAIENWDETKEALLAKWEEYKEAWHSDPEKFWEMTGTLTAEIAVSVVGTKGLDKLAKAATVGRVGTTTARVTRTVTNPVTRTTARAGEALGTTFPRTAAVVRRSRVMSRARDVELARRAAAGGNILSRSGRRVVDFGRDIGRAGRMAVREPGAFLLYGGRRLSGAAAGLVATTGRGIWTATKVGGIPTLIAFQDDITDAINRTATREAAAGEVARVGQAFLDDAAELSPEEMAARIAEVGDAYKTFRNRLLAPVHAEDLALDASLRELDRQVEAGEIPDHTIDARLDALLGEYGRRRHNHMVELYDRNREEPHDMLHPSMNRTISFQDEIDLLMAARERVSDPAARALIDARARDLEALMAHEYDLFRAGDHDVLIAGIAGPPRLPDEDPAAGGFDMSGYDPGIGLEEERAPARGLTDTLEDVLSVPEGH